MSKNTIDVCFSNGSIWWHINGLRYVSHPINWGCRPATVLVAKSCVNAGSCWQRSIDHVCITVGGCIKAFWLMVAWYPFSFYICYDFSCGLHKWANHSFCICPPFLCNGNVQHFIYSELDAAVLCTVGIERIRNCTIIIKFQYSHLALSNLKWLLIIFKSVWFYVRLTDWKSLLNSVTSNIWNFKYFYYWGHVILWNIYMIKWHSKLLILIPSSTVATIYEVYQVGIIFCKW